MSLEKTSSIYPVELAMRRGLTANLNKLKGETKFPKETSKKHMNLGRQGHIQIILC